MNARALKLWELIALVVVGLGLMVLIGVTLFSDLADEVKSVIAVQLAGLFPLLFQAIRNIPQGEAMNRMVDHLARSAPAREHPDGNLPERI